VKASPPADLVDRSKTPLRMRKEFKTEVEVQLRGVPHLEHHTVPATIDETELKSAWGRFNQWKRSTNNGQTPMKKDAFRERVLLAWKGERETIQGIADRFGIGRGTVWRILKDDRRTE